MIKIRQAAHGEDRECSYDGLGAEGEVMGSRREICLEDMVTKNEEHGPDSNVRLQALCHSPITVYVSAYARYGEHVTPRWAKFSLNVDLLLCLWAMADVVKDQKLHSICRRRDPDAWSPEDPSDAIRLEGGLLQLTDKEEVSFLAEIQEADTLVSTERIELEQLIKAAEGPAHTKMLVYQRCGNVLIYAKECDQEALISELSRDGERIEGAS